MSVMLALRANRIPLKLKLAITTTQNGSLSTKKYVTISSLCHTDYRIDNWKQKTVKVPCYLTTNEYSFAPYAFTTARFYADRPPVNPPESSSSFGLPDKQQLERYFFKTVAFLWDFSIWAYNMLMRNFHKYVVQNPTVQIYWIKFVKKLEDARKN